MWRRGQSPAKWSLLGLVISSLLICVLDSASCSAATHSHGIIQSNVWKDVLHTAAKESVKAITKQPGQETAYLEFVPLDTLKVFLGRQHHLDIDLDGTSYQVTLGAEATLEDLEQGAGPKARADASKASSLPGAVGSGLVPQEFWSSRQHRLILPEMVLTGPLELVLNEPQPVSVFLPHPADVGIVHRVQLAAGVTVKVSRLNSISLRRPVELPRLPGQYLAEVYAHAKLGQPEQGFHYAPGMLFMSKKLREVAGNTSRKGFPLLSLEVEPAAYGELSLAAQGEHADDVGPRLKIKKEKDGTLELSVRPGQVAQPRLSVNSLTHVWAWPLPHLDMSSWLPYESMLRGLLASHPFKLAEVVKSGIPMKLTKSSMRGVFMMAFDIHLRTTMQLDVPEGYPFPPTESPLEVWEVVVQVQEDRPKSTALPSSAAQFKYTPMSVRRKTVYGNTLTISERGGLFGNSSLPLGFESEDLGVARYAP